MSRWTSADIPDQAGRTFIVTGANSGLGAATARALIEAGAHVVLACRNVTKGQRVAAELGERASVRGLDLADLASVREFAEATAEFDVLINNAGVMAVPLSRTADGFETQFGTNFLGHFALTGILLPKVSDRVVTLSSVAHVYGKIDLEDLNWQRRPYRRWAAYAQSKLADLSFARELQRRATAAGSTTLSVAAHPGYAATELQSHTESIQDRVMWLGNRLLAQSAEKGALPTLFAATTQVEPGQYFGPDGWQGLRGYPSTSPSTRASRDEDLAAKLWDRAQELTGVEFTFAKR
ncbi:oxidoreductase [Nocardia callitridis]|uniref:Oxidoreductase n=1 Tax=Nocardia callitridis TaxID=648753 RepID=A0ABP9KXA7_9NOCA